MPTETLDRYTMIGVCSVALLMASIAIEPADGAQSKPDRSYLDFYSKSGTLLKDVTQAVAIVAGGIYFFSQVGKGFHVVDISISLVCKRRSEDTSNDFLSIEVVIEKGPRGSAEVSGVEVQVTQNNAPVVGSPCLLTGCRRLETKDDGRLKWGNYCGKDNAPFLNLTPGDRMQLATVFRVAKLQPCKIEAVLIGKGWRDAPFSQWRAEAVSLPQEPKTLTQQLETEDLQTKSGS